MLICEKCENKGYIVVGKNDIPCKCLRGAITKFNVDGIKGLVLGAEILLFLLPDSPERLRLDGKPMKASNLPSRKKTKMPKGKTEPVQD